jgi:predicted amidohydrolase YtcJ
MPSFVDAHCHLAWMGFGDVFMDLRSVRSGRELLDALSRRAASDSSAVLRGEAWDDSLWVDPALPAQDELDNACGGRPAFLRRICGHAALLSSSAISMLEGAGRRAARRGALLVEGPVIDFDSLFPPDAGTLAAAFRAGMGRAFPAGVTALCTMEPGRNLQALSEAVTDGLRISVGVFRQDAFGELPEMPRWVRLLGVKAFLDGAIGASSAAMSLPFADGSRGGLLMEDGELLDLLLRTARAGMVPILHAIGGEALRQASGVSLAALHAESGLARLGVRIEHAEELLAVWPGRWLPGFHRFSMQPNFVRRWQQPGGLYESHLGTSRSLSLNPFATVLAAGFDLGFGSDGMPFGPLYGMPGATGHPAPGLALPVGPALSAYTLGSARMSGFDDLARPVAPGRPADLVVLSGDPFESGPEGLEVVSTICGGRVVHGDRSVMEAE